MSFQVSTPPTITAEPAVTRVQGAFAFTTVTLAIAADAEQPPNQLTLNVVAPAGITVTFPQINSNGTITAFVSASCTASPGAHSVAVTVTDSAGMSASTNFTVNVIENPRPTIGSYTNRTVAAGGSAVVSPSAPPADDPPFGVFVMIAPVAPATDPFAGTISVSNTTGAVSIGNASPTGRYTVSVFVDDGCGPVIRSFQVLVTAGGVARDINGDGTVNAADVVYFLLYLFGEGADPAVDADLNTDGTVDIRDVFVLINSLFFA